MNNLINFLCHVNFLMNGSIFSIVRRRGSISTIVIRCSISFVVRRVGSISIMIIIIIIIIIIKRGW